jgi:hypothetical protein
MDKTEEFLTAVNNDWSDNWDVVVDFFGQETADLLDAAIIEMETRKTEELT